MLLHLPHLTDEVREKSRAVVRYVRPRTRSRWDYADFRTQQDDKRLAWSALTVGGARHGTAHTTVASTVLAALGNDDDAWSRFATSPASYSGPTAWLRLGDVLKAATQGEEWPKPPTTR